MELLVGLRVELLDTVYLGLGECEKLGDFVRRDMVIDVQVVVEESDKVVVWVWVRVGALEGDALADSEQLEVRLCDSGLGVRENVQVDVTL